MLLIVGTLTHDPLRSVAYIAAVVIGLGFSAWIVSAGYLMMQAERREVRAGYTTLYSRRYRHLWQLDPRTGAVVRPPELRRSSA